MSDKELTFVRDKGPTESPTKFWPALVVTGEQIEKEIEQLSSHSINEGGVRRSYVVHPDSVGPGRALAPGIDVAIQVVKPGETTPFIVQNANQVGFCIRGAGVCTVGSRKISFEPHDVWNIPSMVPYRYENAGSENAVFLSYSNAPLLKKLEMHYLATNPRMQGPSSEDIEKKDNAKRAKELAADIAIGTEGARILGYEHLIDIDVVPSHALHWPWGEVSKHLGDVEHLGGEAGRGYQGRHLVILYNPATERRNGTTHSFFASIAQFPPNRVDTPHRHTSAAINYIFAGSGRSTVDGRKFTWKAGDLMLSAPGWAVHNHAAGENGCSILTIQDHPLQIAMESLLWQETLKSPILKLGAEQGVQTNIASAKAAE